MSLDAEIEDAAKAVVSAAKNKPLTFAFAESCTGGMVSAAVCGISGASEVFRGSVVSYQLPIKEKLLGVAADILYTAEIGAVSSECAEAMAAGAKSQLEADIAVSITGIAGPGGEEPGKPVGTVVFGSVTASGVASFWQHFEGDRSAVRKQACLFALNTLLTAIENVQ